MTDNKAASIRGLNSAALTHARVGIGGPLTPNTSLTAADRYVCRGNADSLAIQVFTIGNSPVRLERLGFFSIIEKGQFLSGLVSQTDNDRPGKKLRNPHPG